MGNFREFLKEAIKEINGVALKKVTGSQRAKGEVYVVYSKTSKKIVTSDDGKSRAHDINRKCAAEIADTDSDFVVASSAWAFDQGIK